MKRGEKTTTESFVEPRKIVLAILNALVEANEKIPGNIRAFVKSTNDRLKDLDIPLQLFVRDVWRNDIGVKKTNAVGKNKNREKQG